MQINGIEIHCAERGEPDAPALLLIARAPACAAAQTVTSQVVSGHAHSSSHVPWQTPAAQVWSTAQATGSSQSRQSSLSVWPQPRAAAGPSHCASSAVHSSTQPTWHSPSEQ